MEPPLLSFARVIQVSQDPGKLQEMPESESGQIVRFLALRPDLFDPKIQTRVGQAWSEARAESGQPYGDQEKKKTGQL